VYDPKEKRMNQLSPKRILLVATGLGFLATYVIIQIPITVTDGWESLGSFSPGEIESVYLDQRWNKSVKAHDGTVYVYKNTDTWGKSSAKRGKRLSIGICRPTHPEGQVDIRYCYFEIDGCSSYSHEIYLVVMKDGEVLSRSTTKTVLEWLIVQLLPCLGSVVGMIVGVSIVKWQHRQRKAVDQQNVPM
jgi:hypothetical protein